MKIIPEVKCRRCGEVFSAMRSTCPSCGTRRVAQSTRTPATTPSTSAGTAAYERANVNAKWQMVFGGILVAAVILAVLVMVSTGLNDDSYSSASKPGKTTTVTAPTQDVAPTPEAVPTPTPSPTPQIQTLEIRYTLDDRKREDVTMHVGDTLPFYAAIMPSDITGTVTWRIDDAGKDCFEIVELPDKPNHIELKCISALPESAAGGVYLYASVYGQEVKCIFHIIG